MESAVIRLRVSWRQDMSGDEALQTVIKAVHTDGEMATQMALRWEVMIVRCASQQR